MVADTLKQENHMGPVGTAKLLRWVAWGLAILLAAFWAWFNVASGVYEWRESGDPGNFYMHLVMPAVLALALYLCWKWPVIGGALLIALAVAMLFFFGHLHRFQQTILMLEAPFALTGILFIVSSMLKGRSQPGDSVA